MTDSIGSMTKFAGNVQALRLAQDVHKTIVPKLIPEPIRQTSGRDSASFSSEAMAHLQSAEAADASCSE